MPYNHHLVLSYDQINAANFPTFRIELLKLILSLPNINPNSIEWWVETTITFTIINDNGQQIPIANVEQAFIDSNAANHMHYFLGLLRNYTNGNAIKRVKPDPNSQDGFRNDLTTARTQLAAGNEPQF